MSDQDTQQEPTGSPEPAISLEGNQGGAAPQQSTESTQQDPASASQSSNPYSGLLNAIVNEEGSPKYKTVEEALVGSSHAQEHIRRLEAENEKLRGSQLQGDVVEEIKKALASQQGQTSPSGSVDFESIAEQVYARKSEEVQRNENVNHVNSVMQEKFGEKARTQVEQKAQELGVGVEFLASMAATSPKAFLAYFNASPTPGTPSTPGTASPPQPAQAGQGIQVPSNAMYGASTKELLGLWRQVADSVQSELNQS